MWLHNSCRPRIWDARAGGSRLPGQVSKEKGKEEGRLKYLGYLHVIKHTVWANCHMQFELTEKPALEQCCPISISDLNMSV